MGQHPADDVDAAQREIENLRRRTEDLIAELERRMETRVDRVKDRVARARRLADVPAQVRAHPRGAAAMGVGTLAVAGLGVWWLLSRRADERRFSRRVRRRAGAYRALLADPERALAERGPSLRKRLVTALLIAAATSMTRRLILR